MLLYRCHSFALFTHIFSQPLLRYELETVIECSPRCSLLFRRSVRQLRQGKDGYQMDIDVDCVNYRYVHLRAIATLNAITLVRDPRAFKCRHHLSTLFFHPSNSEDFHQVHDISTFLRLSTDPSKFLWRSIIAGDYIYPCRARCIQGKH